MSATISTTSDRLHTWRLTGIGPGVRSRDGLPPGPRTPMPWQMLRFWGNRQSYLPQLHRRFGDTFTLRLEPIGNVVILGDFADIRTVFRGDPATFHAGEGNSLLRPIVGAHSVLTLDVPEHKIERRRMMPPFHGERIAQVTDLMAQATEREIANWPTGRPFKLIERTQELTLDIIVRVVLGVDKPADAAELGKALRAVLGVPMPALMMWVWPSLGRRWPWRRVVADLDRADALLYAEIAHRRADPNRSQRRDVLSMLLDGDPEPEVVRDELVTLLVAGHETTSVALAWTFERILRHPRVYQRLRDGLDEPNDPYRTAVIKEALRIRPVIYNVARRLTEPVELAGHTLPAGLLVLPSIGAIHTDPRIWGPDATEFRPERWLEPDPPQQAWIPFGGGNRRCLGATFALTEMDTVLRTVLARVELEPDQKRAERATMHGITVVPARGARVNVIRRLG
ncbi:cytochrome P450 [Skermania sp. ID1734]|uniref:cytochrome P450 n=1 Tax=Skermania sp. ID1734 TaxID=2597516 RepID=UPI00117FC78B|nr:cytochrome P450 [Skermania sp. ID1734]TSE00799.1 cytochrome P450 [Skermania sp. ID1734]